MLRRSLALLLCLIVGTLAFQRWRTHVLQHQRSLQQHSIETALTSPDPRAALPLLSQLPPPPANATPDDHAQYQQLLARSYTTARDLPKLLTLHRQQPSAVLTHAPACLLLARYFLTASQPQSIATLRNPWRNHPEETATWRLFDADALLAEGKRAEARDLLASAPLTGPDEALRHLRLALITATPSDLTSAWNHLAKAAQTDPHNAEIHAFRAQLLETTGKAPLARVEYLAAVLAEPRNPLWADQLAHYYLRTHQPDLALDTWNDTLNSAPLDLIALKSAFWTRILRSSAAQPAITNAKSTPLDSLANFIRQNPRWDAQQAQYLIAIEQLQAKHPEPHWLRLLSHLQQGQETQAYELLQTNRHKTSSLHPQLENALLITLSWRLHRQLAPASLQLAPLPSTSAASPHPHPHFLAITSARQAQQTSPDTPPPSELTQLLDSPHAFVAAFIAAGWRQAALSLLPARPVVPTDAPDWLPYGIAQSLRANQSPQAALDYLGTQSTPTPLLSLLSAECHLSLKHNAEAEALLTPLAATDADIGYRAAWLLAGLQLEQKKPEAAAATIRAQPRLHTSTLGQELLATAAIAQRDPATAQQIYQTIAPQSIQARTFLARRAFLQGDYPTAQRLTQELITLLPDKLQLRANLAAILKAKGNKPAAPAAANL